MYKIIRFVFKEKRTRIWKLVKNFQLYQLVKWKISQLPITWSCLLWRVISVFLVLPLFVMLFIETKAKKKKKKKEERGTVSCKNSYHSTEKKKPNWPYLSHSATFPEKEAPLCGALEYFPVAWKVVITNPLLQAVNVFCGR